MQRYSIPDLAQAHGLDVYARLLLHELVQVADWQDEHRGTVRGFTVTGWAEYLGGISRRRLTEALAALETAGLIATDLRRGHDGTVRVLVYDDVTHAPAGRERREAPEIRTRPVGASDPTPYAPSGRERPAETPPKNARVEETPLPPHVEEHPKPPRAEAREDHEASPWQGDALRALPCEGSGPVASTIDALRGRLTIAGQPVPIRWPSSEPLIAELLAAGWTPDALAQRLMDPKVWPGGTMRNPDRVLARRLRDDRLGPAPRPAPRPGRECPACSGSGWTEPDARNEVQTCSYCGGSGRIANEATA